jgi:DNA-binding CsgD family transcriptional regulator
MADEGVGVIDGFTHSPLEGREEEIKLLRQRLGHARMGAGSVVFVSGEAGIGKTSLLTHLTSIARDEGFEVLLGNCYELSAAPPYGPWLELADRYDPREELPPRPTFIDDEEAFDELRNQEALFRASHEFLEEISIHDPLLVIIEDVHWADQASLDLIRYVSRHLDQQRIVLVVSFRDDEVIRGHPLFRLLPSLIRESHAERIDLRPLNEQSLQNLVARYSGLSSREQRELLDYLLERTEGNPLYVSEQLRTLELEGVIRAGDRGWKMGDLEDTSVPILIRQIVERRISGLAESTQRALEMAAVIGHQVSIDLWEELVGSEIVELAAEECLTAQLIGEMPGLGQIAFRHALVRAAIYDGISLLRRRNLHRLVAETYLKRPVIDTDVIAYHLLRGGDPRAAEWLIKAGEQAERRHADREAFDRYDQALEVLERGTSDDALIATTMLKAARTVLVFDPRRSNEYLAEARRRAFACGEDTIAAQALISMGVNLCNLGDVQQGLKDLGDGVEEIKRAPEATRHVALTMSRRGAGNPLHWSNGVLALFLAVFGRYREAIETAVHYHEFNWREVSTEEILNHPSNNVPGFEALGVALSMLGEPEASRAAFHVANYIIEPENPYRLLTANLELIATHFPYFTDDLTYRGKLVSIIEGSGDSSTGFIDDHNSTWGYEHYLLYAGKWQQLNYLIGTKSAPTLFDYWTVSLVARARLAMYQGRYDDTRDLIMQAARNGPQTDPEQNVHFAVPGELQRIAAELAIRTGDLDDARLWLQSHDSWLKYSGASFGLAQGLLLKAHLRLVEGDEAGALALTEDSIKYASTPRQPLALIAAHRYASKIRAGNGDFARAEKDLAISMSLADSCALPYERALGLLIMAETELAKRNHSVARAALIEAQQTFDQLEAIPGIERARSLSRRIGPVMDGLPSHLSRRELDVLRLIALGMTDREIAEKLYISPHTVMRHVSHILAKLGVDSRTAAAAHAVRKQII